MSLSQSTRTSADKSEQEEARAKASFGDHLAAAIARKGWTLAETANEVSRYLPDGQVFNPVNLSHYIHGRSFPRAKYRAALARALDLDEFTFPGGEGRRRAAPHMCMPDSPETSTLRVEDRQDGTARVFLDQVLPWPKALKLLQVLREEAAALEQ